MCQSISLPIRICLAILATFLAAQAPGEPAEPLPPTTRLPVLAYHQVLGAQWYYPIHTENSWILSEEAFAEQMRYLYDNNYTTINSEQLTGFLRHGHDLPSNAVMITFDDGYLDNAVYAAPIMREFGFTGIVFVITGALADEPGEVVAHPAQMLSLSDMRAVTDVFEFGSHTHDMHRLVGGASPLAVSSVEEIRADFRRSLEYEHLDIRSGFAYPHGRHSANAIRALQAEQAPFAFTTTWGYVTRDSDPLRLHRFAITSECGMELFSEIVSGRWVSSW